MSKHEARKTPTLPAGYEDVGMSGRAPETPERSRPSLSATPTTLANRLPYTPGSHLPVLRKPNRVSLTPRPSIARVLGDSQHENITPRQKFRDRSSKDVLVQLDDLRHERYALINEREDMKTQIQLGKQRELKLKAQIDKLEALNSRYKDRASTYTHIEAQRGVLVREQDAVIAQLHHAEDEATKYALQCIELTGELDDLKFEKITLFADVHEEFAKQMQKITQIAAEWAHERDTHSRALRDATLCLEAHQRVISSQEASIQDQKNLLCEIQEHVKELSAERDALACLLEETYENNAESKRHNYQDTKQDTLSSFEAEMLSDEARAYAWKLCFAESDALWHTSKYETLAVRCEWLENTLSHTQILHSKVLAALSAEKRSKAEEVSSKDVKKRVEVLELEKEQLTEQLHHVAWYKEAYDARTKQNNLLRSLLNLHVQSMERVKEAQKHITDLDTSNAYDSLMTRIELLYQEKKKLEARRELLASQAHQMEMYMSAHCTNHVPSLGRSRRVSI